MIKINLSGIDELKDKLNRLKELTPDQIAIIIAEHGRDLAEKKYGGESVSVTAEALGNGRAIILATGDKVGYLEYGTGTVGEMSGDKAEPPKRTIKFHSRGRDWELPEWTYNYYAKEMRKDGKNWSKDHTGFAAQAQMWRTSNELENGEIAKAISDYLDKGE